ncbi:MAG: hypothetical protein Q7T36_02370 [Fluviicoccus sp.]|uniref:hypothetical protein n=1 Tax=Fluviicoccus sp. TaxID=2003552 RepID=UPI002722BB68|nr:hypothetical protein [Fluviicoccus sp.]MDO8329297.1 hypothetical protein [Fluviicoccus sp.]
MVNQTGTVYRTEVSTGSSLSGSSVWVSIDNGLTYSVAAGTSYRKHLVGFSATGIKIEGVNGQSVTPLTGALKTNATYVVEYVTEATGTTIYVYEKGGSRDSGLKHQLSGGAWANIKGFVQTYTGPAVTSGAAIYIDNISVSQPSKNPETDAQRTRYVYNANNQLRFTVDALGYVTERKYDGLGRVVKEIRYAEKPGDLTTWLANPGSLDVTGAQVTRYAYDVDNQLRFTVDALGYVTEQRYDSLGRVSATLKHAKAINVDAVVTEADVDLAVHSNLNVNFSDPVPSGMILTGNAALGSIANEQLAVRPQAAGALDWPPVFYEQSDAITYEAGKVYRAELTTGSSLAGIYTGFSIRNAQSGTGYRKHSIEFENGKAIIVSNGTNGVYAGGELGQLQANTTYVVEIETDSGGTSAYVYVKGGDRSTGWKHRLNATGWNTAQMRVFTKTGHGASGELSLDNVMISKRGAQPDVIAQQTRYVYDAEGRQIFTVDAEGYISERQYDGLGRVTAEIRYAVKPSNLTTWLSNPVSLGATDAQVTRYVYDANNQLRYTVDALGYVTEKQYDSFGRVIQESRYANLMTGSPQSLDYSTISSMALGEKQATTHLYNGLNQEVIQIDALGFVTETRFDGYGHITEKRKSAVAVDSIEGIMTETGRQSLLAASVAAINSVGVQTVMFVNDKLGRLRFSQDELGYVTESQYAANGAKTASIRYSEKYDVADYSEQALMTWSSSRLASKLIRTDFVNDKMGRLLFTVDPTVTGLTGRYVSELRYDANGNVVEQRRYTTAVTGLSLSESGMMSVLTGAVFVRQSRAVYDALGRVRYTLDALGYISENIYDNFGRVIEKRNYDRCLSETSELTESAVLDALAQPRWVNEEGLSSLILAMSTQPGQIQMQSLGLPGLGFDIPFGFVVDRMPVAARAGQKIRMEVRSDTTGYYQLWFQSGSRRHGVDIKNGSFRFVFDVNNSDNIAPVFDPRGSITSMATYILEMEVTATGTALSWYEKGQPPTTGYSDFEAGVLENDIALGAFSYEYPSTTTDWGNLYLSSIVTSAPQIATLEKYSYDNGGRLQSTTDSLGFTESYIYDAFGNRTKKTDKKGEEWNYLYDSLNRLVEEVTPALTVQADYSSVPVTGFVVNRNYYDSFGNVVSRQEGIVRKGTQPRVSNGNDEFNQVRTTRYGYDSLNRQVLIISPGYYDTLNRRFNALELSESELTARLGGVAPSDPTGGFLVSTRNYYDGFGRLSQTRVRINNTGVYADDYADSFRFYDARDQLRSEIDALGYVTGYDYDCYGNQVSQKRYASALANVADIAQDGVLVDDEIVKDAVRDRTIFSRYDELGRKIGIWQDAINLYTTPSGSVVATPATRFEYDSMGNVVRESREAWDLAGNMVTSLPASITRSFYDAKGRRIGVIDPLAYYTSYTYDVLDHVVSQREYAGQFGTNVDQLTFSGVSAKAELQESAYLNPQNRYTYFQYDVMGRLVRTYVETKGYIVGSAAQQVSATEYDEAGLVRSVTDKAGNITQTVYDNAGRVIKVIDPEREAAGLGALRANMAMIKASPEKNYILNAHGEVVKETVSAGVDANGGIQIGGSRITRNVYDASGNLIAMINPDVKDTDVNFNALRSSYGVNNYQIDASGNIICDTQKVKAVFTAWLVEGVAKQYDYSIQTSYAYDKLNRQKSTGVDGAVAYGNDSLLALVNTGYGRTEQSAMYNAFGEVSSRALNGETQIVYDYDQLGHVKSTVDGEGLSTFEYDHLGNGTRQTKKGADTDQYNRNHDIGYTYLAGNQSLFAVSDAANANAPRIERVTLRLFDLLGRETAQQLPSFKDYVGTTVYPVSYKIYDRWGNATEMNDNGTVVQYQYDMFNRVIRVESPASVITDEHGGEALANMIKEYSYDSMDNVIAESDTRGQYFDSQGITVAAVAVRFKSRNYYAGTNLLKDDFDANFAGVGSSSKNSYQYDAFGNQITKVNGAGNLSFMYYDSMDRLVSHGYINNINIAVIEDSYKYDYAGRQYAKIRGGGEEVAETLIYDDVNLVLSGDAGNVEYFEYDERGNVVLTHDESGVSKRFIYDVNNRKIAETMPFMSLYSRRYWAYDSYGRVVMTIDGDVCCAFAYDRFGQLSMEGGETSVTYPSYPNNWRSAKAYTYLDNGLLSKVAGEHNWSSYQYNVRSQKMQEENGYSVLVNGAAFSGSQKVNYMYDSLGRLSRMWAPAGTVAVNNSTRTSSFKWGDVTTITASIANTSELYSLNIAYDAFGNRRKVSLKATASSGVEENWYKYDAEGRMTIAEGFLNANHEIVMGLYAGKSKGLSITYDSAGRRATEESFKASLFFGDQYQQKRFTYQTNGELLQIDSRINVRGRLNGELRDSSTPYYSGYYNLYTGGLGTYVTTTRFTPSLLGVTQQLNYNESSGALVDVQSFYYRGDGKLYLQTTSNASMQVTQDNLYGGKYKLFADDPVPTRDRIDRDGLQIEYEIRNRVSPGSLSIASTAKYTKYYAWVNGSSKDDYIGVTYTGAGYTPGGSDFYHSDRGDLTQVKGAGGQVYDRRFTSNADGKMYFRGDYNTAGQLTAGQTYFYFNGNPIANIGTISGTEFGTEFTSVSDSYPSRTPSSYNINSGDTFASIAQSVWGDSNLGYLIADANGLNLTDNLSALVGRVIDIPNRVTNIHNDSTVFGVYDPGKIMGDTTPQPKAPPPPKPKKVKWWKKVLIALVSVAAMFIFGPIAGSIIGNIASQLTARVLGVTHEFSWKQVGKSFVSAIVSFGVGQFLGQFKSINDLSNAANSIANNGMRSLSDVATLAKSALVNGATSYAADYLANKSMNIDTHFSWSGVASSVVGSGLGSLVSAGHSSVAGDFNDVIRISARDQVSALASARLNDKWFGGDRPSYSDVAYSTLGSSLGKQFGLRHQNDDWASKTRGAIEDWSKKGVDYLRAAIKGTDPINSESLKPKQTKVNIELPEITLSDLGIAPIDELNFTEPMPYKNPLWQAAETTSFIDSLIDSSMPATFNHPSYHADLGGLGGKAKTILETEIDIELSQGYSERNGMTMPYPVGYDPRTGKKLPELRPTDSAYKARMRAIIAEKAKAEIKTDAATSSVFTMATVGLALNDPNVTPDQLEGAFQTGEALTNMVVGRSLKSNRYAPTKVEQRLISEVVRPTAKVSYKQDMVKVDSANIKLRTMGSTGNRDSLIGELIADSNKKFPLTEVNARKMLYEYAPDGYTPRKVAGPGGAGADLVFDGPGGAVFKIENKSTTSFGSFKDELSHAAQRQAQGNLVFVQVPEGVDVSKWMSRFWGYRKDLYNNPTPENIAKLDLYRKTEIVIHDEKGVNLLPRQPIYNPK